MSDCNVPGCKNNVHVRGVCNAHYLAISRGKLSKEFLLPRKKPQGRKIKPENVGGAVYARRAVSEAIKAGKLVRPDRCELCKMGWPTRTGVPGIQAHHYKGYDHPLDVQWLCIPCHRRADDLLLFGERNPHATLTDEQVQEIRERRQKGELGTRLAEEFGVTPTTIYNYEKMRVRK